LPQLSDAFAEGRRFRILVVVDDFTRECPALVADTSLPGQRVVRELEIIIAQRGRPAVCVSDNGTELSSMAVLRWSHEIRIEWHYIAPGKPTQNAFIGSFNVPARRAVERNTAHLARPGPSCAERVGPHSALGNLTPAEFAARSAPGPQRAGALRYTTGSAPRPVAPPSPVGSNIIGTLPVAG